MYNIFIKDETVYVRSRNGYEAIDRKDVLYFEALGKKVCMHSHDECRIVHISMSDLERLLTETACRRTHRSFIVNFKHVSVVKREFVLLKDETKLPVGRKFLEGLKQWLYTSEW